MTDGTPSQHDRQSTQLPATIKRLRLLIYGFCGAATTVFFWYIPLSPLLGGAIAGYLYQGTEREAHVVGAIAGALVPLVVALVAVPVFLLGGGSIFGLWPFQPVVMVLVVIGSFAYSVGVSIIGGHIGGTFMREDDSWGNTVFEE